jgi:hypothetical protein
VLRFAVPEEGISEMEHALAEHLAQSLSVSARYVVVPQAGIIATVEGGAADVGIGGLVAGRGGKLAETSPYAVDRPFLLTRRGEAYPSEAAMSGMAVLSCVEFTSFHFAEQTDVETGIARLYDKTADVLICSENTAIAAAEASEEALQAELFAGRDEVRYVAVVAKGNERLFAHIDAQIDTLVSEGFRYGVFR